MRNARILQDGAIYHVVAKANRGEFILDSDDMKKLFLNIVCAAKKKYRFKLKHYCIMSNHIHLLIEPLKGTSLSRIMQWILSNFARMYNKLHGLTGHVWYDRFKSKIIKTFQHFTHVFKYISNNPVKAGICNRALNYHYCGLYEFVRMRYKLIDPDNDWMKFILN